MFEPYFKRKYRPTTDTICTKRPSQNLLGCVAEELNPYATRDTAYTIAAIPMTTSKLGPSGSLKNHSITLEHTRAVRPSINNKFFFDLNNMLVIILDFNRERVLKLAGAVGRYWNLFNPK